MTAAVLVGCEESGVVRDAFAARGFDAWSCDLQPSRAPGQHMQCHIKQAIESRRWDLIIIHPPCTALCSSGNAHYGRGKPLHDQRIEAATWTHGLWLYALDHTDRLCMENPRGCLNVLCDSLPRPQYIQPHQYGHNASKETGLWLHNLPRLLPTHRVHPRFAGGVARYDNQTDSGQNRLSPSPTRARDRSRTYPGVALAMAQQWGRLLK